MFIGKIAFTLILIPFVAGCSTRVEIRHDIPEDTRSPGNTYGITVPHFHFDEESKMPDGHAADREVNEVVNLKTGRTVAVIGQEQPGYDRTLNHHGIGVAEWSSDSSLLLWEVGGKWFDDSLVLLKIEDDKAGWQLDLMKAGQQAILGRTKEAAPNEYAAFRKSVTDDDAAYRARFPNDKMVRSAYPEGFTIDVRRACNRMRPLVLPLKIHVDLTSNPKGIEGGISVNSYLNGLVTKDGKFMVTDFKLGCRPPRDGDIGPSWR